MAANVVAATTIICSPSTILRSEAPAERIYCLRKSYATVHFDPAGKGQIVFLPKGAELRLLGCSRLCECFEVMYENQSYNIFKVDLLGPWSTPIKPIPVEPTTIYPSRIKPIRTWSAVKPCA